MGSAASGGSVDRTEDDRPPMAGFEAYLLDQVEAAVIASDLAGTIVHWNHHAEKLYGWPRDEALGRNILETTVLPDDREGAGEILDLVAAGQRFEGEFGVCHSDGSRFEAYVTLSPLIDADGHLAGVVGVSVDITERHILEEELRHSRDELDIILRGVADGITVQSPTGELIFANDAAARTIGFPDVETLLATPVSQVISRFELRTEDGRPVPVEELPGRLALQGETVVGRVLRFAVKDTGEERWSMVSASPVKDEAGQVQFAINIFHDITEQKRVELADRFVAEASELLSSSLDYGQTLSSLAELIVPRMADWCLVDVLDEDGTIRHLAVAHADRAKVRVVQELRRRYPPDPGTHPIHRVIATGTPEVATDVTDGDVTGGDEGARRMLDELGTRSHMIVPLSARGRTIGAISFVSGAPGRYGEADLVLAQSLAARAGLAVDNARLYRDAQATAREAADALTLLDTLLATAPVGFAFLDTDLRYVRINEALAEMNGLPAEDHLGKAPAEMLPDLSPEVTEVLRSVLSGGGPVTDLEVQGVTPAQPGHRRSWLSSFYPVTGADGTVQGVGVVVAEITQRAAAERRLATQSELARVLAGAETEEKARGRILEVLGRDLEWDLGAYWRIDPDEDEARVVEVWTRDQALAPFEVAIRRLSVPTDRGVIAAAMSTHAPHWIVDLAAEPGPAAGNHAAAVGLSSAVVIPIVVRGRALGAIQLASRARRDEDAQALEMKGALGTQLGQFMERKAAEEAVRRSEERLRLALDAGRMGTWRWHAASGSVQWDEGMERIFGLGQGTFEGSFVDYASRLHPDDRDDVLTKIQASFGSKGRLHVLHRAEVPGRGTRWIEGFGVSTFDAEGAATGMIGVAADVTERQVAEQERRRLLAAEKAAREDAEAQQRRFAFLAEASALLSTSLDYERTLQRVAELAVPRLADWCAVDILQADGTIDPLAVAHADPAKLKLARELREKYPPDPDAPSGVPAVIRTGRSEFVPEITRELLDAGIEASPDPDQMRRILDELRLKSAIVVPLRARGRSFGALTMVWAESGRRYDQQDLELAEELGRRAAVAIDNARLFRERSHVARTLQRSLLPPELPDVPGVELGASYHAAEEMEVGGDFYDVFDTGDSGWGVVMGDVCGRGADAAALTALARYTVRAAAMRDRRPSQILRVLNEAIIRQHPDYAFATVAYLRLRPNGEGVRVTVAAGGHPLPLVLRAAGTVEEAGAPGTLLGVFEDPELTDAVVDLRAGDAIVLYTDGVTESRGAGPIYGEERLKELLSTCAGEGAQEIADRIEADVVAFQPQVPDDIAILALRVCD